MNLTTSFLRKKICLQTRLLRSGVAFLLLTALASSAKADVPSFTYTTANGEVTITGYAGNQATLVIPGTLDGFPVVRIGEDAFQNLTFLTNVTIPDSVTSMGNFVFSGCSGLQSVTLSNNVNNIGESTFYNCTGLTNLTIPNSVTSIGSYAFFYCNGLTSLNIPDSVTNIDDGAFQYCSGLTSVAIPKGMTSIQAGVFANCTGLTSVTIPKGITSIEESAFYGCSGLTRADFFGNAPGIGPNAFANTASGFKVYYSYFSNQKGFTKPKWSGYSVGNLNPFTTVASGTSAVVITGYPKTAVGALVIPEKLNGKTVTRIESGAFYQCSDLTSIDIPDTVQEIGDSAFNSCLQLKSVTIPGSVTNLGAFLFHGCRGLKTVKILAGVITIPEGMFFKCSGLTSVTLPSSLRSIGNSAFQFCDSLPSVVIPNGVTSIGNNAFSFCSSLANLTLPSSVTSIGLYAFSDCLALTGVTIPDGVTTIAGSAFLNCTSLARVIIPNRVSMIEDGAFDGCISLSRVDFSWNAPALGNAFSNTSSSLVLYRSKSAKGFDVPPWTGFSLGFNSLPLPWRSKEIGSGKLAGYSIYNAGTYIEAGSGAFGTTTDKFRFTYQTLSGDGEIVARISMLQNTGNSSRVGVMIRDNLATNSPHVFVGLAGNGSFRLAQRLTKGGGNATNNSNSSNVSNAWVRLVRKGNEIRSYKSISGDKWTLIDTMDIMLAKNCYVGLAVASGNEKKLNTSRFSNVKVKP